MSESLREPLIWDWENARACILKEKKPFKHCRNTITEWYDKKTSETITDPYRKYNELKRREGLILADKERKWWTERKKEVEWDEYRSLKLWEISGTVFGCTYLGNYECPIVSVEFAFPYKSLEEAISDLSDRWDVKVLPRHGYFDFLHIDGYHPMCDIVMHRLGIRKIGGGLYFESDIEMVAYEVKNATSQYYMWWGDDGSYGNSSFRNSLGLAPTVDIEKALAMRITRLYNDTVKNLMDVNLNRIKFAEIMKDLSEQATKNITQGELF